MSFYAGLRPGSVPMIGATLQVHMIADDQAMTSICGQVATYGWSAGTTPALQTDLSQVTCGACLAALTRHFPAS
jgi:hypothetical protein